MKGTTPKETIMATLLKLKNRSNKYRIRYRIPIKGKKSKKEIEKTSTNIDRAKAIFTTAQEIEKAIATQMANQDQIDM